MATSPGRESSPDWLREFQSPAVGKPFTLSSSSASSGESRGKARKDDVTTRRDESDEVMCWTEGARGTSKKLPGESGERKGAKVTDKNRAGGRGQRVAAHKARRMLTEDDTDGSEKDDDSDDDAVIGVIPLKKTTPSEKKATGRGPGTTLKSAKKEEQEKEDEEDDGLKREMGDVEEKENLVCGEEGIPAATLGTELDADVVLPAERRPKQKASSSLPLIFPEKINRNKVLVEADGERAAELDLSGDVGAVGRFSLRKDPDSKGKSKGGVECRGVKEGGVREEDGGLKPGEKEQDLLLDIKGTIYRATIIPTNTLFVVNVGQSEAKVEAVISDFLQLREEGNLYQHETVVEGTLDGWLQFGSDDEQERAPGPAGPSGVGGDSSDKEEGGGGGGGGRGDGKKAAAKGAKARGGGEGARKKAGQGGGGGTGKAGKALGSGRASSKLSGLGGKHVGKPKAKAKGKAKGGGRGVAKKAKPAAKRPSKASVSGKGGAKGEVGKPKPSAGAKGKAPAKEGKAGAKGKKTPTPKKKKRKLSMATSESESDDDDDADDDSDWS